MLLGFLGALVTLMGGASDSYFIRGILYKTDVIGVGSIFLLWSGLGMFYSFILWILLLDKEGFYSWKAIFNKKVFDSKKELVVISSFCILSILTFIYYQAKIYPSPLILAIQGDPAGAALKRIEVTRGLSEIANTYIISFGLVISQIFNLQLVYRNRRNSFYEKYLKYLMVLLSI